MQHSYFFVCLVAMQKFKPVSNDQLMLLPPSVEDFIPSGHLARVINDDKFLSEQILSIPNCLPGLSVALNSQFEACITPFHSASLKNYYHLTTYS